MAQDHPSPPLRIDAPQDPAWAPLQSFRSYRDRRARILVTAGFLSLTVPLCIGILRKTILREEYPSSALSIDRAVLAWALDTRRYTISPSLLENATGPFAPLAMTAISLLCALVILALTRSWRKAFYLPLVVCASGILSTLLKNLFALFRPWWQFQWTDDFDGWGFPSGHTTGAAALGATVALMALAWALETPAGSRGFRITVAALVGAGACLLTVVAALTRLFLGVHYLSDTVGGAFLGLGVALVLAPLCSSRRTP